MTTSFTLDFVQPHHSLEERQSQGQGQGKGRGTCGRGGTSPLQLGEAMVFGGIFGE